MPEVLDDTLDRLRAAMLARDRDALPALLDDDVVLRSPILSRPFTGRAHVQPLLEGVQATFEDLRYTSDLSGDGWHAMGFTARVGGRQIQGVDLVRLGEDGRIAEFQVLVRPLIAVVAVARVLGGHVAARHGRPWGALLRTLAAPQALMAAATDGVGPWFVRP